MGTVSKLQQPQGLLGSTQAAIKAMTWLTASDGAMVALALEYATKIDASDDGKTLGWLGQNLAAILKTLGGSPAERKALGIEEPTRGKLAELRNARR